MANEQTAIQRATNEIESVLASCNAMTLRELPALAQAVTLATGVTTLRKVLTDELMKSVFMPLQGTPLGFLTDRDNAKEGPREYPITVVREVLIEALIHGFRPVGNEINIIAGRCYGAQNGYARLVADYPGLTDLQLTPGVPVHIAEKGALVPYRATWRLNGVPMELRCEYVKSADGAVDDTRIPVKVNANMGADAIIGKAKRKFLKQIYDRLTGSKLSLADGEAIDTVGEPITEQRVGVAAATAALVEKHRTGKNGSETKAPELETKPASGETKSVDDLVNKHRPPSSPQHDPASGEVAPENEPRAREPGQEG